MKKYINWLAFLSLVLAYGYGFLIPENTTKLNQLQFLKQSNLSMNGSENSIYKISKEGKLWGYLANGSSQGYGGPMKLAVICDTNGTIIHTDLINSFDTPSFLAKLENRKYYDQYQGKKITSQFQLKKDIEAVSGATVSSLAIANSVQDASYHIANQIFGFQTPSIENHFRFTAKEIIVVVIFLIGFTALYFRRKNLIYVNLFLGLIFIGFLFNASLSLTHFGRMFLGYFPDIHTHLIWWILMAGTLGLIFIWGKNVYCSTICPFHATQLLLHKISGINLKLTHAQNKVLSFTPNFLIWLSLILIFISKNPSAASYEPFALLFSLKGIGIQWYILPTALIGSLFFNNFFCRFFCPVGNTLKWLLKKRNVIKNKILTHK